MILPPGFHEDGFASGLRVSTKYLGVTLPFTLGVPDRCLPRPVYGKYTLGGWAMEALNFVRLYVSVMLYRLYRILVQK